MDKQVPLSFLIYLPTSIKNRMCTFISIHYISIKYDSTRCITAVPDDAKRVALSPLFIA